MLDLFTIFSKGGIVLWYFQGTCGEIIAPVNALIKSVVLQERGGGNAFTHQSLTLKYKLDNEFELVFVVGYQKVLQLSYVDKFISDVHLFFREKYKNQLEQNILCRITDFEDDFTNLLKKAESSHVSHKTMGIGSMKSFGESEKSKKSVSSMIERPGEQRKGKPSKKEVKSPDKLKEEVMKPDWNGKEKGDDEKPVDDNKEVFPDDEEIRRNIEKMTRKKSGIGKGKGKTGGGQQPLNERRKAPRVWELNGSSRDAPQLDFSDAKPINHTDGDDGDITTPESRTWVGRMHGDLQDITSSDDPVVSDDESDTELEEKTDNRESNGTNNKPGRFSMISMLKGLVGQKKLKSADVGPVLDKLRDHLIGKNVASDIADKLCGSVATKLEGKVLGTFSGVTSTVRGSLEESLLQILSPRRRVDILRDVLESRRQGKPFSIAFCGVNGVGKSTNLAKIAFWLIENNFRILIAACDTFRAGAVEQLRTHVRHLNALHPASAHQGKLMVQLYEKGYGKDAAGIAMEAIRFAGEQRMDVCLIDTAGRMQDNEPLMRALSKLIKVNEPNMVLFVGEALVGNEAVDQLVKFNQALADNSTSADPRLIDGIVLTKFDTIDDKVGAAISMTYTTGQPIVFVGTGQTYTDLRNLNVKSVVNSLMKA